MIINLAAFERTLQGLIEGIPQLILFGQPSSVAQTISKEIALTMEKIAIDESPLPREFILKLNAENLESISQSSQLLENLAAAIKDAAANQGLYYETPPKVSLVGDALMQKDMVYIYVPEQADDNQKRSETAALKLKRDVFSPVQNQILEAFLILHGQETYLIEGNVVNIGRREDNHLVIEDMRVSRNHAQLRRVKDHFMIFDLNSTGGTFINQQRISQAVLQSGDVISLAGFQMIYNEVREEHDEITERIEKK